MNKVICVYSSSSNTISPVYFDAAARLGAEIARKGDLLLFGGGMTGLMGACARAVHQHNGTVIGVIPEALNEPGIVYEACDELVVTAGMRERKAVMDSRSDAFVALPGGFGTIEEIMEIITLKQLRYHSKPIVILNIGGYFTALIAQLRHAIDEQFAKPACLDLFFVTDSVATALEHIDAYVPASSDERWLTDVEAASPSQVFVKQPPHLDDVDSCKIDIFIPRTHLAPLQEALRQVGAGHFGTYDSCLSYTETTGCWRPLPGSHPYDGTENVVSTAPEYKVEVLCRCDRVDETLRAIKAVHPYETPVINVIALYKTGL
ncbi:TIGR00730 family Rossman fold protein [Oscillospiraceae bacterium WX1]